MTMFKEEGYRLMGAAFEVYNQLGTAWQRRSTNKALK
jgi:hypothetical protein